MKKISLVIFIILISNFSFAHDSHLIRSAVISCIQHVDYDGKTVGTPEIFFWSSAQEHKAINLMAQGYELKKSIKDETLCGGNTPIIKIDHLSKGRFRAKEAINNYNLNPEDGFKIWETDLFYKEKE